MACSSLNSGLRDPLRQSQVEHLARLTLPPPPPLLQGCSNPPRGTVGPSISPHRTLKGSSEHSPLKKKKTKEGRKTERKEGREERKKEGEGKGGGREERKERKGWKGRKERKGISPCN